MKEILTQVELIKLLEFFENTEILLEKMTYHITALMNAQGAVLRLLREGYLHIVATCNIVSDRLIIPADEGIYGEIIKDGDIKTITNDMKLDIEAHSAIFIPLKINNETFGIVSVYNKISPEGAYTDFTDEDRLNGEFFSSIASLIIHKSLEFNKLREKETQTKKTIAEIQELKNYVENLIQSSADAIIATDLNNIVTAWNRGAEEIFGFTKEEVIGKPLSIIPDFFQEVDRFYIEKIKQGETLKNLETVKLTKNGKFIEVNLTISPIKDARGQIIGISRIIRDITEKKNLERDLIRRNEELTKILFINSAVRSTLELNKLLRMILTVITMGEGLGFNRAILFLIDEEKNVLRGAVAIGPSSYEEAWQIWSSMAREKKTLFEVLDELGQREFDEDTFLDRLCKNISIPLSENTPLVRAVKERKIFNIKNVHKQEADPVIIQQLGSQAYAVVPLISKDKPIGVVWVDNFYTRKPITEQDINFLKGFADQVAGAIENAWIFDKIEKAEKELEMLFNSITDLIYYTDNTYTIKKANRSFLEKLGLEENEVINKKCFKLIHNTEHPPKDCPHRKAIETGRPTVSELEENYLDGIYILSSSPIFDSKKNLIGTINVAKNITELKNLRERIISMEKMAVLGEMAAKVAHEIRNPLLAIGGFAKRLDKEVRDQNLKEYIKVIVDEVRRLERILNETLSFVKPYSISKEPFNITALIDDVTKFVESTLKERNNEFIIQIEEEFPVLGNYDKLKEVFLNLITNSNEATENGMIILRIKRPEELPLEIAQTDKEYFMIEVEDTGCGIQKENIKKIFDPFFTTKINGTGLGLSISKKIVEEHGGIINVESEINKGTIFRIYLPVYKGGGNNENFSG